jgi:hypothetical protein
MQTWQICVSFLSLLVAFPFILGLAYVVWDINPLAASMVVMVGVVALIAEGLWTLDRAVGST